MKFSYNWLVELSGADKGVEQIAQELTLKSFEVEGVVDLSAGLDCVVVGEVLEVNAHPDADRLRVAVVDVADVGGEKLQIVCGAPNLAVGQKVPVALVGAKLPTADGSEFEIKKSKIRGVESSGMICAEDELGLGTDHDGIMVLDSNAPVGENFAQFAGLDDTILGIDILPNRAHDCLSHVGVAREICAVEGRELVGIAEAQDDKGEVQGYKGEILDDEEVIWSDSRLNISVVIDKCPRYTAVMIEGVDNTVITPDWMHARLRACGLKSINPIVDITNYVMLETGQPSHAFDAQKFAQNDKIEIGVSAGKDGEKLKLLDEREIELNKQDLVIEVDGQVVALAGVMGGLASGATLETTKIVLEVASFDAGTIRATKKRHGIESDAAYRFERELDPNLVEVAQTRALELIAQICGGEVVASGEYYPEPVKSWQIELSIAHVNKLLGTQIAQSEIAEILERLEIKVKIESDDKLTCVIPTFRLDLRTAEDLMEEVGRLYGYENIVPKPLIGDVIAPMSNDLRKFEYVARGNLTASGCDEVKTYSFYSRATAEILGLDAGNHVALANPMNPDQELMRRTLTGHLLQAARVNLTHSDECSFFEIGRTYVPIQGDLPREHTVCAIGMVSKQFDGAQFFMVKGIVENLLNRVGLQDWQIVPQPETQNYDGVNYHPSRRALVKLSDGTIIGAIGEATRKQLKFFGIKKARVATAEIDLEFLRKSARTDRFFAPIGKFPTVQRDLSMITPARLLVADVERTLYDIGAQTGNLVTDIDLFDLYINPKTAERSMAFHITFAHPERTLNSIEIDQVIVAMIEKVEAELEVSVRQA